MDKCLPLERIAYERATHFFSINAIVRAVIFSRNRKRKMFFIFISVFINENTCDNTYVIGNLIMLNRGRYNLKNDDEEAVVKVHIIKQRTSTEETR